MKHLFKCVALFLSSIWVHDVLATDLNTLVVELKSDTTYSFSLNEAPRFALKSGSLCLEGDVEVSFLTDEVSEIYFASKGSTTSVPSKINTFISVVYQDNEHIRMVGVPTDVVAFLYASDGRTVGQVKANKEVLEITLPEGSGIYLVQVNNQVYKFIKR